MQLLVVGKSNSEISKAIEIAQQRKVKVYFTEDQEMALDSIRNGRSADLILIDVSFDIKKFIDALAAERISSKVVAYGRDASPKEAVAAIKNGATEFISLPPNEELISAILETVSDDKKSLIYKSPAMNHIVEIADKVSKSDAHILITGESGTGKEVLASYIHNNSNRSSKNFVKVNCAAIPDNLIESELFGHEKGAFTGAVSKRIGKFEESSDGTLLLDEVSEMDIKLQAKLLRAIQEKEIDRIGGTSPVKVNLRIIATSNRDLQKEISNGTFREDLFFRLNVINIELPSLRDRKEDIQILAEFFIKKYCASNNIEDKILSPEAVNELANNSWQGNIRELENSIHRAVLLSSGTYITPNDLFSTNKKLSYQTKQVNVNGEEKKLILNTINYCLGDVNQAAYILGISINQLTNKLKEHL